MVGYTIFYYHVQDGVEVLCCWGYRPKKPLFLHMCLHDSKVLLKRNMHMYKGYPNRAFAIRGLSPNYELIAS